MPELPCSSKRELAANTPRLAILLPTSTWVQACFMLVCADGTPFLLGLHAAEAALG